MFSHEELAIRRTRIAKLRRITKFAQQAVVLSSMFMAYVGILGFEGEMWGVGLMLALAGFGFSYFSRWIGAVGTAISDNYDLLEDIHHNFSEQQADKKTEG